MMKPSIDDLLKTVDCKFTLVVETSKRARQLVSGAPRMVETATNKPISVAIKEIYEGKIKCDRTVDQDQ